MSDFHPHWLIQRPLTQPLTELNSLILDLNRLQGRGRPRGALGGASREAKNSTRRLPSIFELPLSTAPAALGSVRSTALASARVSVYNAQPPPESMIFEQSKTPAQHLTTRPTTRLALQRIKQQGGDTYEPGTIRERGYMRGISSIWHHEGQGETGHTIVDFPIGIGTGDLMDKSKY